MTGKHIILTQADLARSSNQMIMTLAAGGWKLPYQNDLDNQPRKFQSENIARKGVRFDGHYSQEEEQKYGFDTTAIDPQLVEIDDYLTDKLKTAENKQRFLKYYDLSLLDGYINETLVSHVLPKPDEVIDEQAQFLGEEDNQYKFILKRNTDLTVDANGDVYVLATAYDIKLTATNPLLGKERDYPGEIYAVSKLTDGGFELQYYVCTNPELAKLIMTNDFQNKASISKVVLPTSQKQLPPLVANLKAIGEPANKKYLLQCLADLRNIEPKTTSMDALITYFDNLSVQHCAQLSSVTLSDVASALKALAKLSLNNDENTQLAVLVEFEQAIKQIEKQHADIANIISDVIIQRAIAQQQADEADAVRVALIAYANQQVKQHYKTAYDALQVQCVQKCTPTYHKKLGRQLLRACDRTVDIDTLAANDLQGAHDVSTMLDSAVKAASDPTNVYALYKGTESARRLSRRGKLKIAAGIGLLLFSVALVGLCIVATAASFGTALPVLGLGEMLVAEAVTAGVAAVGSGVATLGLFGGAGVSIAKGSQKKVTEFEIKADQVSTKMKQLAG